MHFSIKNICLCHLFVVTLLDFLSRKGTIISRKYICCSAERGTWKPNHKQRSVWSVAFLYDRCCDIFGFGEIEFLTDLGFALVDGLKTLTSEHVDLLGGEIGFQQTT